MPGSRFVAFIISNQCGQVLAVGLMKIKNINRYSPLAVGLMEIENLIRHAPLAVGLMEIKNINRYSPLAVGVNPSARQGEARLRGLYRT